ncbi:MAG TPA: PIN domain-containing protein [Candidatus Kapabacteria bacterium]|nr:PIN domain-containing protein [Candidatus Kapabacteria bacterium]
MILVDTNIIIDYWRQPNDRIRKILIENDVYICGVIKTELLYGSKDVNQYHKIKEAISDFPIIDLYPLFWDELGYNLFTLKKSGLTVPIQDAMIATLAINFDLKLWTNDKHFFHIQRTLLKLQIFENI